MSFHEVSFPLAVGFGSTAGPGRKTEIITLGSGREERNTRWAHSRRRYDAGYGVRHIDDLHQVIEFFEQRRGMLYGFRFRDPLDWKSCPPSATIAATDQKIGIGNGEIAEFALIKNYGDGENLYQRRIYKPVTNTVLVAVNGSARQVGNHYTLDAQSGKLTFATAHIPPANSEITCGFAFDTPVRFDTDQLSINLAAFQAGEIPSIPMIEILP